jgi:hypothetical protein
VSCSIDSAEVQEEAFPMMKMNKRQYKKKMEIVKTQGGEEI